jgi:hypothetical protein
VNVDAVVSDKKKTTMLDLAGSPSFNYEAAAVSLNTANATRTSRKLQSDSVEMDRREKIHRALQNFGLATAGASIASPPTALFTEIAGSIADLTDGILYSLEGEHGNAALSYASILPVVGAAVAAKRGMKVAEKAGEELIDVYHGYRKSDESNKIIDFKGEKYLVGGQYRWFDELDDKQLDFIFNEVGGPGGPGLLKRYKETGEFPLSLIRLEKRVGPKQYKEWGKTKEDYLDDLYTSNEQNYLSPGMKGFMPLREEVLPREYFRPNFSMKEIRKNPFAEHNRMIGSKFLNQRTISRNRYFTTSRAAFATTEYNNARRYSGRTDGELLHFKIPKSYMMDKIENYKLRGQDTVFGEKFDDFLKFDDYDIGHKRLLNQDFPITKNIDKAEDYGAINEMIFDEGIPMRFLYKTNKTPDLR